MNTKLLNLIAVVLMMGITFLGVSCSDDPGTQAASSQEGTTHVHADGTVHTVGAEPAESIDVMPEAMARLAQLQEGESTQTNPPGTHVHADGTVHADDAHTAETQTQTNPPGTHVHDDGTVHADDAHTPQEQTPSPDAHIHTTDGKTSQVTFRSDRYEIFLEHQFIVANEPVTFVTHVTDLVTLMPRRAGSVKFILRQGSQAPIEHIAQTPARDGIYLPELTFPQAGQWTVTLVVPLDHQIELPPFTVYGSDDEVAHAPAPDEIVGISFLKEQQWPNRTRIDPVQKQTILDQETLAIPESALVDEGGTFVAFVQLAGETFKERHLELGRRENGLVEILSGLSEGEYVVTNGAAAIMQAQSAGSNQQTVPSGSHVHADGTVHADDAHTTDTQTTTPPGTHTHADGTVHADDAHTTDTQTQQAVPPGSHTHADGTVHADDAHATDDAQTDDQGRAFHLHGDGSIHYLDEPSESRVSGSVITFPAEDIVKYGLGVGAAAPGQLEIQSIFPGEIAINADNMAHIVPRTSGIVREVKAKLGDLVHKGDVMAVIDSRELADAKSDYLASVERLELAQVIFDREEKLWQDKISSEQEYLNTRQVLAEAKINIRSAKQKLIFMGFTSAYLDSLPSEADDMFTRYEVVAPFDGTVIEKHVALGEVLKDDAEMFIVADLSTVWINIQVYKKDLPIVRVGQHVCLVEHPCLPDTHGEIDYIGPIVGPKTQTAIARIVQPNPTGELRPGLFVNARVTTNTIDANVLIHKDHVQYYNDAPVVFIQVPEGFELRGVTLGETDGEFFAITNGLAIGERYATTNSFLLKSEMDSSAGPAMHVHADGTVHIDG